MATVSSILAWRILMGASLIAHSGSGRSPGEGRRDRLSTPVFLGFPCGSAGKESACNVGDLGLIPGLGRSPEKGKATHSNILAWRIP